MICENHRVQLVGVKPNEGLVVGWAGAIQTFFWVDNAEDLKTSCV